MDRTVEIDHALFKHVWNRRNRFLLLDSGEYGEGDELTVMETDDGSPTGRELDVRVTVVHRDELLAGLTLLCVYRDNWGYGGGHGGRKLVPTLKALEMSRGQKRPTNRQGSDGLLPTLTGRDWKSGRASEETHARNSRPLNEVLVRGASTTVGLLNHHWLEHFMGFPERWTSSRLCKPSETPSSPSAERSSDESSSGC